MEGQPPFGHCSGYKDHDCNDWDSFANDDIFYLEVCIFSMVCKNSKHLFEIDVGEPFLCEVSQEGFDLIQRFLREGPDI